MSVDIPLEGDTMPDLKPCPFCGSTHIRLQRPVRDGQLIWQARCATCGAELCHPDRDHAITRWNTRKPSAGYTHALAQLHKLSDGSPTT